MRHGYYSQNSQTFTVTNGVVEAGQEVFPEAMFRDGPSPRILQNDIDGMPEFAQEFAAQTGLLSIVIFSGIT